LEATLLFLAGCAAASAVLAAPSGVSKFSFREYVLNNGFYSRQGLTGLPKAHGDSPVSEKMVAPLGSRALIEYERVCLLSD